MSRVLSLPKMRDAVFAIGILGMLAALVLLPEQSVEAARGGVELCVNVILPSLFPFFVLSTLSVELGLIEYAGRLMQKVMYPLFRVNGACAGAFVLGIVGGYPVGARTVISLYESGQCSRTEAERMLSFCNNSGPAFILGVVGAGVFSNSRAGLLLYGAHVAASLIVGIVFRFYHGTSASFQNKTHVQKPAKGFSVAFTDSIKKAFNGTLNICGFVIFFTVLVRLLFRIGAMGWITEMLNRRLNISMAESLLTGIIEITSGVWSLRDHASAMGDRLCMAAFILGWAGLSVHCQVLSFIGNTGLSTRTYFAGKLLHGILSAGIIYGCFRSFGSRIPVSSFLATQVCTVAEMQFGQALIASTCTALLVFLALILLSREYFAGRYGNQNKNSV